MGMKRYGHIIATMDTTILATRSSSASITINLSKYAELVLSILCPHLQSSLGMNVPSDDLIQPTELRYL